MLKAKGEAAKKQLFHKTKYASTHDRGYEWTLTFEQFERLTGDRCHYCGVEPKQTYNNKLRGKTRLNGDYIYNGIDRMENGVGYTLANCVTCCKVCNRAKRAMPYDEFVGWLKGVADKWRDL